MTTENDELKIENSSLKDVIKQSKQGELSKLQELEKALFEKQQKSSREMMSLSHKNDDLMQRN